MTTAGSPDSATADQELEIAAFLRARPDFLDQHPELLKDLVLSHDSGQAVSLVERQVHLLREENRTLQKRLDALMGHARTNEQLNRRIQVLSLALLNAVGLPAVGDVLVQRLREDFGADDARVLIFASASITDTGSIVRFAGDDAAARQPFASLLESGKAYCGAVEAAQQEVLFGAEEAAASAVLMPLSGAQWTGIFAIASRQAERYRSEMGTEFLDFLTEVLVLIASPWVKRLT
jgi:uncharacterized protein YigA (DUF484 family)